MNDQLINQIIKKTKSILSNYCMGDTETDTTDKKDFLNDLEKYLKRIKRKVE